MSRFTDALKRDVVEKPIEFLTMAVTAGAVIVGLVGALFVYRQILDLRQTLDSQAYAAITQNMNELDKLFVEHPEARPYFRGRNGLPDKDNDKQQIFAIADIYLNFIDTYYDQANHLVLPKDELCAWRTFFKHSFERSPVLCALLCSDQKEYGSSIKYIAAEPCKAVTPIDPTNRCQLETIDPSTLNLPEAGCNDPENKRDRASLGRGARTRR